VLADEARRAAEPRGPARRAAEAAADLFEDFITGKPFNSKKAASAINEFASHIGGAYASTAPDGERSRRGSRFDPPDGFQPPPNWHREPPPPPGKDPAIEREARRVLGFGPADPLTEDLIKERRRQLARKHHPDKGGSVNRMQAINSATDALIAALV